MNSEDEAKKLKYDKALEKVVELCKSTLEVVYRPERFVEALGLDVSSRGLATSLSSRFQKLGFLLLYDKHYKPHYGLSEVCGSGECFEDWCLNTKSLCRTGKGNDRLKIYHSEEKNPKVTVSE